MIKTNLYAMILKLSVDILCAIDEGNCSKNWTDIIFCKYIKFFEYVNKSVQINYKRLKLQIEFE